MATETAEVEEDSGKEVSGKEKVAWDPFVSPDWDNQKPSSEAIVRIKRDLHNLFTDPPPGIFVAPVADDITKMNILIIGPFDTPYEGGFFHFYLRFSPNYPRCPPRVKFMTTGSGRVRFNPNLYCNGKVCLSILGYYLFLYCYNSVSTWPGPQWSPSQNLTSIILSIQSLLNETPFHNEPGFHQQIHGWEVESYNDIVRHETLRVAVCDTIDKGISVTEHRDVINVSFLEYFDYYITTAETNASKLDRKSMMDPFGFNKGIFDFTKLVQRLRAIHSKLQPTK